MTLHSTETAPFGTVLAPARPPDATVTALSTSALSHRVAAGGVCSDKGDNRAYPSDPDPAYARVHCLPCGVRHECLEIALRFEELTGVSHGVWGGTTPAERQLMMIARREVAHD